jgi:hypothetical protein
VEEEVPSRVGGVEKVYEVLSDFDESCDYATSPNQSIQPF